MVAWLLADDVRQAREAAYAKYASEPQNESDLARNYQSPCDPRLNYEQSLELAFLLARKMQRTENEAGAK